MTFTIDALSQCDGGNHVTVTLTIDGKQITRTLMREDLIVDRDDVSLEERIKLRMASAVKEATTGNPTALQIRNALLSKTFEV